MQQAQDFSDECQTLEALLRPLSEGAFETSTGFKNWTFNNILRHLHVWNYAAYLSLADPESFRSWINVALKAVSAGRFTEFEAQELNGASGHSLLDLWSEFSQETARHFADVDPSLRVEWAGPSMSARSSMSARHMETWAHAQAIYDALGVDRVSSDSIKNIVVIGVNTYDWTFKNRGMAVPQPKPLLELVAPSGAPWTFGDPSEEERITGQAEEFCQVVTQTRNIADTNLKTIGDNAAKWMSIAQCFAGPPVEPPKAGLRKRSDK
ncbi:TIGR03084 family metal-binding protein [Labrenzia sp. PHM005]|uniref:TIGR03084 family metal-binding protein n=1 Tax=Labrenzia sp. PHM005 TaxID=2590016 RepID=UPI0011403F76|nr:TIGR03084 family metal-binding protein [Labrenzia sp. PHM005]QDG76335.1 TIGR03084 family protein [Labrenzia sp. PHM005]